MRSLRLPFRASALLALAAMTLAGCGRTVAPVTTATDRAPATALRAGMVGMDGPAHRKLRHLVRRRRQRLERHR